MQNNICRHYLLPHAGVYSRFVPIAELSDFLPHITAVFIIAFIIAVSQVHQCLTVHNASVIETEAL